MTKLILYKCHLNIRVRFYLNTSQSTLMEQMEKVLRNMTESDQ